MVKFYELFFMAGLSIKYTVSFLLSALPEGKVLVINFEFGGSFVMCLEGDCHDVEFSPNLKL
jgi:hypothetical protein